MTATETYRLQRKLRDARQDLDNLGTILAEAEASAARQGALVGSGDYLKAPDYRKLAKKVDALAAEVALAQAAVGGVVYRVPTYRVDVLSKKIAALTKRASKHDLGSIEYRVTDERFEVENKDDLTGRVVSVDRYAFVVLRADRLKLAGWALLAKLSVEEAGVLVSKIPALARAWTIQREGDSETSIDDLEAAAKEYLDNEVNLADYADPETASNCDHCGLSRRRTATFVVESLETGERKQVGSNCLRDFLGVDPAQLARYAESLIDLENDLNDDGEEGFSFSYASAAASLDYLVHVCTVLRVNGWAPKSNSDHPTAQQAEDNRWNFNRRKKDKYGNQLWIDPTEEDADRADAARTWAIEYLGKKVDDRSASDFDRNLYIAAANSTVSDRTRGTLAYCPVAYDRYLEKEIEFAKARDHAAGSEHVGTVGERVELTLKVTKIFETEGNYGTTFITQLEDADGNTFKWFGSYRLELDEEYVGKWTIKGHSEYKGRKETQVTRPKLVEREPVNVYID